MYDVFDVGNMTELDYGPRSSTIEVYHHSIPKELEDNIDGLSESDWADKIIEENKKLVSKNTLSADIVDVCNRYDIVKNAVLEAYGHPKEKIVAEPEKVFSKLKACDCDKFVYLVLKNKDDFNNSYLNKATMFDDGIFLSNAALDKLFGVMIKYGYENRSKDDHMKLTLDMLRDYMGYIQSIDTDSLSDTDAHNHAVKMVRFVKTYYRDDPAVVLEFDNIFDNYLGIHSDTSRTFKFIVVHMILMQLYVNFGIQRNLESLDIMSML